MGRLDIALLGPPLVRADGRLLAFPTRKAAALLFFLAASGEPHPREQLAALLWPESDEERARGTLRTTLAMLRGALGSENAALLVAERDRIGLAASATLDIDLRAVETAYALARREGTTATQPVVAQLRAAAGRYRGDFLTGFSLSDAPEFDDWAAQQREVWHRRADLVFDRLSQELFEGGEFVEAGEVTARWVAGDPLNEAAHRRLMRIHFAAGDRAGALRAYEACRAVLVGELRRPRRRPWHWPPASARNRPPPRRCAPTTGRRSR
jgi:DNA-binding SARP family transcriptional activator